MVLIPPHRPARPTAAGAGRRLNDRWIDRSIRRRASAGGGGVGAPAAGGNLNGPGNARPPRPCSGTRTRAAWRGVARHRMAPTQTTAARAGLVRLVRPSAPSSSSSSESPSSPASLAEAAAGAGRAHAAGARQAAVRTYIEGAASRAAGREHTRRAGGARTPQQRSEAAWRGRRALGAMAAVVPTVLLRRRKGPRNLFELLRLLPGYGVGARVYPKRWRDPLSLQQQQQVGEEEEEQQQQQQQEEEEEEASAAAAAAASFFTVTRVKPSIDGVHGSAWGILTANACRVAIGGRPRRPRTTRDGACVGGRRGGGRGAAHPPRAGGRLALPAGGGGNGGGGVAQPARRRPARRPPPLRNDAAMTTTTTTARARRRRRRRSRGVCSLVVGAAAPRDAAVDCTEVRACF
eukprot:scaffold25_cov287-Prasinococcus_capsulatus_cf.AAC.1